MDINIIIEVVAGIIVLSVYLKFGKKIGADKVKAILKAIYDLVKKKP